MFNFNKTSDTCQCFMERLVGENITFNCKQLMHFRKKNSNVNGSLVGS